MERLPAKEGWPHRHSKQQAHRRLSRRREHFLHLSKACGATDVDIPQDVIDAALEAQPVSGDKIGPGVFVA
jgi:hypothetical protein